MPVLRSLAPARDDAAGKDEASPKQHLTPVRIAALALLLTAPLAAQPTVDVSGAIGSTATAFFGESVIGGVTTVGALSATATPKLPRGVRVVASAAYGPGDDRGEFETVALGVGVEAPLSGGRNGVYVALGGAWLDFDGRDRSGCTPEVGCLDESGSLGPYTGLAATVGLGARVPIAQRLWVEPAVATLIGGSGPLPGVRLGVGWRVR